jgi:type IV secretory pathway VirB6-like protein
LKIVKQQNSFLKRIFLIAFYCLILSGYSTPNSYADVDRYRTCTPEGGSGNTQKPFPETLHYDATYGGKDFSFDQSNSQCIAVILPPYIFTKLAIQTMNWNCSPSGGVRVVRPYPTPINDAIDITKATARCIASRIPLGPCCVSVYAGASALSTFLIAVKAQHSVANDVYHNTSLCGGGLAEDWVAWDSKSMKRNKSERKSVVAGMIAGWRTSCNKNPSSSDCAKINNGLDGEKEYREWFYDGVEREDVSDNPCPDVTAAALEGDVNAVTYQGFKFKAQKYYMRGTSPGNFNCGQYNHRKHISDPLLNIHPDSSSTGFSKHRIRDFAYASQCCLKKRSKNACVERKYCTSGGYVSLCPPGNVVTEHKFCEVGSNCQIGPNHNGVLYKPEFKNNNSLICVKTSNQCPYDFNIGGGSLYCNSYKDGKYDEVDGEQVFTPFDQTLVEAGTCDGGISEVRDGYCKFNSKAGNCKNYCQYLNHCTVAMGSNYVYETKIVSPYFSSACIDFVGDSKNKKGYGVEQSIGVVTSEKHFTAPIAQCLRETIENVFYNKAGNTRCGNAGEYPDQDGNCASNDYVNKKGESVADESFFSTIQSSLVGAIKLVITMSIVMQGFKILLTGEAFKRQDLIMYIAKIGLVLFFATGAAWQKYFFDGIYNSSTEISQIVMNIKVHQNENQRDGCQFGKGKMPDGSEQIFSVYPKGKQYLSIFDTLDCKIARYLGFGPEATIAGLAKIILPALISPTIGAIGIYFAILTLSFGIMMIVASIRALYIFFMSSFALILLIYVSPITITCVLFKKTSDIFNKWLLNLISYAIQPILLFAYIGLFISVMEVTLSGSATYDGAGPTKILNCQKVCVDPDGTSHVISGDISDASQALSSGCDEEAKIVDPRSDSVACMLSLEDENFGSIPSLEALGVTLPILVGVFEENGRQKILTMMKAALVMFILAGFIEYIPNMATLIIGGNPIPTGAIDKIGSVKSASAAKGLLFAVQKRGVGGIGKAGSGIGSAVSRK